ncbi:hypothetical protein [Pseudomonas sp. PLB05]|uniref:hypothetical protein n=1 Tax=Pseudomonas sp. PLB05 TaxID=2899078 RepID=UPI001E368CAA|nr:hypothetical protein [Pseudomonas sp. PLB05]MCD4865570.1 hypothetical protein [Pseudomonas sp. PLB05]
MEGFVDVATLKDLAARSDAITQACRCQQRDLSGWTAWPVGYRETDFAQIGTLGRHAPEEAILEEYHSAGTHYWSNAAPIAPRFHPYNQSTLWRCLGCQRLYLRHNDDGAYHVAPRIRLLQPALIVDAAHANDGREATVT